MPLLPTSMAQSARESVDTGPIGFEPPAQYGPIASAFAPDTAEDQGSRPFFGGVGSFLRRAQQAAGTVAENAIPYSVDAVRQQLVHPVLTGLDRARQASLGFFTGENPAESVQQAYSGLTGEARYQPEQLGFVRNMAPGRAREALTNIESGLVDPLTLASLGGGLPLRAGIGAGLIGSEAAGQGAQSAGLPGWAQTVARGVGGLTAGVGAGIAASRMAATAPMTAEQAALADANAPITDAERQSAAIEQARRQQYGGVPVGQVRRVPGQFGAETISLPQTEEQIAAGNAAAASRAMGDPRMVDPLTAYRDAASNLQQRIIDAQPLTDEQRILNSQLRQRQAGAFAGAAEGASGEAGFNRALGAMRGQAERTFAFQPLRDALPEGQADQLFSGILQSPLRPFEQAQAGQALRDLLDGTVPTPSALAQLDRAFPGVMASVTQSSNILPPTSGWQRALDIASDVINAPRSIMASGDLSASLRQAAMAAPSHPRAWWQAMKDQVGSYRSPEAAQEAMARIDAHPLRDFLDRMRVDILPIDSAAPASLREEAFMSRLANKVPLVERSQRAYTTALNSMRAGVSYDILGNMSAEQLASMSDSQLERLGAFVNAITGRGHIPAALERYQPELNAVFFSPRNTFGKVQANLAVLSSDPIVRREAAKSLAAFYGTGMGILAAARLSGLQVGVVPGSGDFGKIVLPGGTRVDIWGGNAQLFRLIANLTTGSVTSANGQQTEQSRLTTIGKFLRSKLSPGVGEGVKIGTGTDFAGHPWAATPGNVGGDALRLLTPLFAQDLYDATRAAGVGEGLATGAGSFFGLGVQPHAPSELDKVSPGGSFYDLDRKAQMDVLAAHPDLATQQAQERIAQGGAKGAYAQSQQDQHSRLVAAAGYLQSGQTPNGQKFGPAEFRAAVNDARDTLAKQREIVYGKAGATPGKDAVVDGYYRATDAAIDPVTGKPDWDKVDAYVGSLTPEQQAHLDRSIGLSFTDIPQVAQYARDSHAIAQSGYWKLGDEAARKAGDVLQLPNVTDRNSLSLAAARAAESLFPGNTMAQHNYESRVNAVYGRFAGAAHRQFLLTPEGRQIAPLLVRWGYNAPRVAYLSEEDTSQ